MQKLLTLFSKKNFGVFHVRNFNETLTNDVVSFEQPDPGKRKSLHEQSEQVTETSIYLFSIFNHKKQKNPRPQLNILILAATIFCLLYCRCCNVICGLFILTFKPSCLKQH